MDEIFIQLKELQKKAAIFMVFFLASLILMIVLFLVFGVYGFIGVALAIFFGIFTFKNYKNYASFFKENVVRGSLNEVFDNLVFEPKQGISPQVVYGTGMIQRGDIYSSNDWMSGEYHGVAFSGADVHIEDEHTDSEGHTTTTTVFRGRWMIFDFNKTFKCDLQIVSKGFYASRRKGGIFAKKENKLNRIELENQEFNKLFRVFAQNQQEAFYILTPHMMENLMKLRKNSRAPIMLMFVGGCLHIAVQNNKDAFEPKLFGKVTPESEKNRVLGDIRVITDFVDEMALDRDIYKI